MTRDRSLTTAVLLPLACIVAVGCLIAAELSTLFEFRVDGRIFDTQGGGDRHGYALAIIAAFALGALGLHLVKGQRPAAVAVAAAGALALVLFLIFDLPDVNQVGELDQPVLITSKAEPASGFWLELIGAVGLTLAGAALAAGPRRSPQSPMDGVGTVPDKPFDRTGTSETPRR